MIRSIGFTYRTINRYDRCSPLTTGEPDGKVGRAGSSTTSKAYKEDGSLQERLKRARRNRLTKTQKQRWKAEVKRDGGKVIVRKKERKRHVKHDMHDR